MQDDKQAAERPLEAGAADDAVVSTSGPPPPPATQRRRRRWWLWAPLVLVAAIVLLSLTWAVISYRAFAHAIGGANARLPAGVRSQLVSANTMNDPQVTLVAIVDGSGPGRPGSLRSVVLLRTDPGKHRISLLAVPVELRAPGRAPDSLKTAYALHGASALVRAVRGITRVAIAHVMLIDTAQMGALVDQVGGIDVGGQHLTGSEAIVYLGLPRPPPRQAAIQLAFARDFLHRILRPGSLLSLPSVGRAVAAPLATDLSAMTLLRLGWISFRASSTVQCYLGGSPTSSSAGRFDLSVPANHRVVAMFAGRARPHAAAQPLQSDPGCGTRVPAPVNLIAVTPCNPSTGCSRPPVTHAKTSRPTIAWPAVAGSFRYGVRINGRVEYPYTTSYRLTTPLTPKAKPITAYVYAYTYQQPNGVVIGTVRIRLGGGYRHHRRRPAS